MESCIRAYKFVCYFPSFGVDILYYFYIKRKHWYTQIDLEFTNGNKCINVPSYSFWEFITFVSSSFVFMPLTNILLWPKLHSTMWLLLFVKYINYYAAACKTFILLMLWHDVSDLDVYFHFTYIWFGLWCSKWYQCVIHVRTIHIIGNSHSFSQVHWLCKIPKATNYNV